MIVESTGWSRSVPDGRVFALIIVDGYCVPVVAQYDPPTRTWAADDGSSYSYDECTWVPFPYHESICDRMCAVVDKLN